MPHDHDPEQPRPGTDRGAGGAVGEVSGGILDEPGDRSRAEVIGRADGDDGPGLTELLTERLGQTTGRWARRHRRLLWLGAAMATVLGLVAGGFVAVDELQGPPLPEVVEPGPQGGDGEPTMNIEWGLPPDGQVAPSPLSISVPLELVLRRLPTGPRSATTIITLEGPGLLGSSPGGRAPEPIEVPEHGLVAETKILVWLDCGRIPLPVPATGFGVRIRVDQGRRNSTGVVPLPRLGTRMAPQVQAFCGGWLARRELSVTAASFTVDPHRPEATGTMTVTNSGSRRARIRNGGIGDVLTVLDEKATPGTRADQRPPDQRPTDPRPADAQPLDPRPTEHLVPAHGSTTVAVRLQAIDCAVGQVPAEHPTTFDLLGVTATVSPGSVSDDLAAYSVYIQPSGIPLTAAAASAVTGARSRICAGLPGQFVVVAGQARHDRTGHRLTVPLRVDVPGADILSGVVTGTVEGPPDGFTLLTPPDARLSPARSGRGVGITLVFRVPGTVLPCSGEETPFLPLPMVSLQVRTADGVRTVPIQLTSAYADLLTSLCS